MAQSAVETALVKLIAVTDRLSQFEAKINTPNGDIPLLYTCQVRRDQVRALWEKVEREYEACTSVIFEEMAIDDITTLQAKYDYCYSIYERLFAWLPFASGGDYTRWPTFRDLFTANYINNNGRLSEVEKLFHLNAKTSGEAHSIVSKSPLANEGFQSARSSLTERFENKRLLVNSQLTVLFNLPVLGQESGSAIHELQSTIQGCLTALEHSKVNTENWDCILVFVCSSKLPKLTLSL
ncbi:hypothetical protein KR044_002158, partial [Drosophila immigrans]